MNATLRKLAASIILAFADGTQAQTLVGTDFTLERRNSDLSLTIDLSSNLQSRNKGLLCYYEAQGLLLQHAQLQSLRISEKDLVKSLERELKPDTPVQLILTLGEGKVFSYPAHPALSDRAITLSVQEAAKAVGT
ncbi:MAG: hypothetical protein ACAH83_04610 [Alphaproteobacteria bacterium]